MKTGDIDLPAAIARLRAPGAADASGFVSVFADDLEALLEAYDQAVRAPGAEAPPAPWEGEPVLVSGYPF